MTEAMTGCIVYHCIW